MLKTSDDSALFTLLQGSELDHDRAQLDFFSGCNGNFLDLDMLEIHELVFVQVQFMARKLKGLKAKSIWRLCTIPRENLM